MLILFLIFFCNISETGWWFYGRNWHKNMKQQPDSVAKKKLNLRWNQPPKKKVMFLAKTFFRRFWQKYNCKSFSKKMKLIQGKNIVYLWLTGQFCKKIKLCLQYRQKKVALITKNCPVNHDFAQISGQFWAVFGAKNVNRRS